jgi:hypothetical protein
MLQGQSSLAPNEKVGLVLAAIGCWSFFFYVHYAFSPGNDLNGLLYKILVKFDLLALAAPLLMYFILMGSKYVKANETVREFVFGLLLAGASVLVGVVMLYIRLKI